MASTLCYVRHDLISHLREILQWNTLTIIVLLSRRFPTSTSDFSVPCLPPACTEYSRTAVSAAGKQWKSSEAWLRFTSLGLCPSIRDCPEDHIVGLCYCQYTILLPLLKRVFPFSSPGLLFLLPPAKIQNKLLKRLLKADILSHKRTEIC